MEAYDLIFAAATLYITRVTLYPTVWLLATFFHVAATLCLLIVILHIVWFLMSFSFECYAFILHYDCLSHLLKCDVSLFMS